MSRLISKTLRLPPDICDFVELQPGDNFTDKFIGLIRDYQHGQEDYESSRKYRESQLRELSLTYRELYERARYFNRLFASFAHTIGDIDQQLADYRRQGADP